MGHKSGCQEGNGSNDKPLIIVDDVEQKNGLLDGGGPIRDPGASECYDQNGQRASLCMHNRGEGRAIKPSSHDEPWKQRIN